MVAASGLLGLAFADTLLFAALSRIGAARLAVVDTVYAPTVVLISFLFLGERFGGWFFLGALGVLGGVALASIEKGALGGLNSDLRRGLLLAWVAISSTATGVVLVKPVLEQGNLIEVTWSRLVFGVAGQLVWMAYRGQLSGTLRSVILPSVWRKMLPATILGTWFSLLLWLGGFKWAPASVAAVLNQLGTIYLLVLARLFLKEELRLRQAAGALLAACGALFIVLTK
jgi:drug/metabolite transporter (DMT)-like permease